MKKAIQRVFQATLILTFITTHNIFAQDQTGGLALYTVRDDMGTNAKATLQAVAETGYKNIEAAGYKDGSYYGMSPKDFKAYVKKLNLKTVSTHQSAVTLDNMNAMFADAKTAGFKYFVVPIPPMGWFKYDNATATMSMNCTVEELAKTLDVMGENARKAGLKLLYHNHDFEFMKNDKGIVPIDYLLENCNPKYVNFQMDLFWVTKAGADPLAYFKKYPKRFKMWHVKDMDEQGRFAPVGKGTIDFKKILAQKKLSGMKYFMVEQDQTFDDMKPLDAIKISHQGIKTIGFK
ncbi:sugar phosphate isomerase/epimerase [Maribacter algarum]|uniref:Sugar phosphate isomerase/epimerase n=1 Tax=Maribacter algarum (ex Zhang et al. 2020) TaxID=2578118 RepID=A0A5S3QIC3_9FLAO|nr:sugar phosphate isomerase/epimerase [Maribacter algarum]TMM57305.1 sugar phosphate isomerase/epimerase [Maribacter algarum]